MVMPCSRSASSPSTSSAKSISLAGGAVTCGILGQRGQLVFEDQLGIVQQPPDQGRLAVVHRPAGDEAQQVLGFAAIALRARQAWCPSEIALALLLLHGRGLVGVDQPALPFRNRRGAHLRDDVLERSGAANSIAPVSG